MFYLKFLKVSKTPHKFYRKNNFFDWLSACKLAFDNLKKMIIKTPIFAHYK